MLNDLNCKDIQLWVGIKFCLKMNRKKTKVMSTKKNYHKNYTLKKVKELMTDYKIREGSYLYGHQFSMQKKSYGM